MRWATAAAARGLGATAPSLARSLALGGGAQGAWQRRRPFRPGEGVPEAMMEAAGVNKGGCSVGLELPGLLGPSRPGAAAGWSWSPRRRPAVAAAAASSGGGGRPGMVAEAPREASERRATSGFPLTRDEKRWKEREMGREEDNGSAAAGAQPPTAGGVQLGQGSAVKVARATRVS
ncbi:uncharacterized protein LOC109704240 [Ananas comosus]|uniref:Uncharacterized protein LOC109704240 n=1 Tax=Ananas comosus TaxID=4615 RepID=A0A6P5EBF6_ANACO|nr:uncharacterized protein LOC109704240 [Ananas comosus]